MNYSGRPVFLWAIDWGNPVNRSITYDLREMMVGFGAEYFVPTETDTAQGWAFTISLLTADDVSSVDAFMGGLYGRLQGFWLPVPFNAMAIVSEISATQFNVTACGLTDTWNARPDVILFFTSMDGTQQIAAITGVIDNGDGTEQVTVGTALDPVSDPTMTVRRLQFVRLADDTEKATYAEEGYQVREFSVIELPLEYADGASGTQPIFLYHFWAQAPVLTDWYYTSFAAAVWSNGIKYLPFPMTHGQIAATSKMDSDDVTVDAKPDDTHPLSLFFPAPFGGQMNMEILTCMFSDPNTTMRLFKGFVRTVKDMGSKFQATCSNIAFLLERKVSRMIIQADCNYPLYSAPCGVTRQAYETTVVIVSVSWDGATAYVVCTMAYPAIWVSRYTAANWFAGGIFETGIKLTFEPRTIISSAWNIEESQLTLTLNLPLIKAVVGQRAQITAGCDGSAATCKSKFNNFARFGGFPSVPQRNLTLEAFETQTVAQGGKK
jgi:uncharacterized phage protein (TIGR02218 family)